MRVLRAGEMEEAVKTWTNSFSRNVESQILVVHTPRVVLGVKYTARPWNFRALLDVTGSGGADLYLEALGGKHVTQGIKAVPLLYEGLWGCVFPSFSGWNQLKILTLKLGWVGSCFPLWPRPRLCSSRALSVLAAPGTTPGLQPAPVGGGPLASGLSLQPSGPVPVA